MPELPDIVAYLEALERRILKRTLAHVRLNSPFLLRSIDPPVAAAEGQRVTALRRVGKRIAIGMDSGVWLVIHLMIAGRLHWKKPGAKLATRRDLAAFDFDSGTLTLTEAGTKRRASLHVVRDPGSLDPGGIEVIGASPDTFRASLVSANHTLKRALTDPRLFSGIGNAYSDEILHRARLSPVALTQRLAAEEVARMFSAVQAVLGEWIERLRRESVDEFPEGVTAFRPEMAVHGKVGKACPVCGAKIARIRYAENETNYCPGCQTGGRLLADRSLSRLLKSDWPRTPEELEERLSASRSVPGYGRETERTSPT
jgi:formamidopyrimidine-DNA glycosylase